MIKLSTDYANGEKSEDEALQALQDIFHIGSTFDLSLLHLESDQKYFNLIPLLRRVMPQATFVWLLRDGRDVVASTYSRGWFSERLDSFAAQEVHWWWNTYRLTGADAGDMTEEAWEALSPFERNCWYWSYVNATIERDLGELDASAWRLVRLESLKEQIPELCQFLGVETAELDVPVSNAASYEVRTWDAWSEEQWAAFERWCGPLMDRYYPDWRAPIA